MTYDGVPLIPRSVLFGNPTYAAPTFSPDGTKLGYLAPEEGVLNVWVGPRDLGTAAHAVTHDRGQGIRMFGFCHDDRTLFYLQDSDGDENWQLHLLDLESGDDVCVTPFGNVQVQVLAHNRWHPTTMLLGINKDNAELHDVYRLDLESHELQKVRTNTGYAAWFADTELRVRGAITVTEDGGSVIHLARTPDGELEEWRRIPVEDSTATSPIGFAREGNVLYLTSSVDANAARLLAIDLDTDAETVLAEDAAYDVGGVEPDPETRVPQAVVFEKDREEWVFLDEEFERAVGELRAGLDLDGELGINRGERSGRHWLVSVVPSDGPIRFYAHDRDEGTTTFLFAHRPDLAEYTLAPMEPFAFTARDGLEVHGYITFPVGAERHDLPAVLNVHGGPWARDLWGYHPEAQWLANRGYACVQVNFRGSTGYGKSFLNAGDKQWGQSMHTDLLDTVDHVVQEGWVDRTKIAIMGGSYGGYAALAAAAFTPAAFRCAVDLCGPSNLLTLLASIPPYWKPMVAMMHAKVGHPEEDKELLWDRSPLSRVDDITIPVLVAQGANDPRVKQAEAEQIVQALKDKGLPHEYLLFDDEGHGLARPESRERFYAATERFLTEHLGGRSEEGTAAAHGAGHAHEHDADEVDAEKADTGMADAG